MKFNYIKITFVIIVTIFTSVVQAGKSSTEKSGDILQVLIPATAYATTFFIDDKEGRNHFWRR